VAALILGSHALHDILGHSLRAVGPPQTISVLWSLSVAAEAVVFFFVGPGCHRLTPAAVMALAPPRAPRAGWWQRSPLTSWYWPCTAAADHVRPVASGLLRLLAGWLPLAATAQAIYGTGRYAATALLTVISDCSREHRRLLWVMSVLCLSALPVARGLRVGVG
jgi:hypothetical protein